MLDETTAVIDWSTDLPPFAELVAGLAQLEDDSEEEAAERSSEPASADLEEIRLSLSIELEVRDADRGAPRVTGSTPTQWTETTVLPVFHRLSMRITRTDDDA